MDGDVGTLFFPFYVYHDILFSRDTTGYYFYEKFKIADSSFDTNFLRGYNVLVRIDVSAPC